MRTKKTRLQFAGLLAGAFLAAVTASCGGGNGDAPAATPTPVAATPTPVRTATPEEAAYFSQLKSVLDRVHEQAGGLADFRKQAFDEALSEQQRAENAAEYARRYQANAADAGAGLGGIDAPFGLDAAHASLAAAAGEVVRLGQELATAMEQSPVTTSASFNDLFFTIDGVTRQQRFRDYCFDLQAQAGARGADVDLECNR